MAYLNLNKATELSDKLQELSVSDISLNDRMLKLRQILEQLYKSVTEDVKISFNGLFARMQYANDTDHLSQVIQTQANQLRILCNKIAHDEVTDLNQSAFDSSLHVMESLLQHFCTDYRSSNLERYLSTKKLQPFAPFKESRKTSFICVIETWQLRKDDGGRATLQIEGICEDGINCHIILNDDYSHVGHDGRLYSKLNRTLWKYASLHCHHLSSINGKEGFYQSNPQTMLVLEPDFLVDASAIAECFADNNTNPAFYILNRMFTEPSTEAMLQGLVVNSMLDELVFTPNEDYLELFKHSLASMPIAFVSIGKDSAKRIYNTVDTEHLPQLQDYIKHLGDEEILLEPSYICPEYGLQGRLDMLRRKDDKYSIVELKSGKAPSMDVWKGHQMQTIAYNMIIRSVYGSQRINNASILYSHSKENPVRHVVNLGILEQDLLMCRNRIMGVMHLLSTDPSAFFNWLTKRDVLPDSPFMQARLQRFITLMGTLEDWETQWFYEQVKRVIREIWFVKTGDNGTHSESSLGHNALWQQGSLEKQKAYKIIAGVTPFSYNKKQIIFSIPPSDDIADFREGDIVVIYRLDEKIYKQEILRGIINKMDDKSLEVSIRGGLRNSLRLTQDSKWALEHDTLETSLYSPLSSLISFLSADKRIRDLMLGISLPENDKRFINEDEEGMDSILKRMHCTKELFIVQGPPGTGKTSGLLGTYVKQLHEQSSKRIFILSFTNRAVDEICLCLIRLNIPFLRVGNSSTIREQLLNTQIEGKRFEEMEQVILGNRIWISTVQSANAWYLDLQRIVKIDEVIIDEASQIIENSILGIISQAPKTILIGDQNQLPPISVQSSLPYQFTHPKLIDLQYGSYHQSLMERLYKINAVNEGSGNVAMLRRHFRMHDGIAGLVSHYYRNKLVSATSEQKMELKPTHGLPEFLNQRIIWINTPVSKISHYDPVQVNLIVTIIKQLIQTKAITKAGEEIGIVAPFRAMIHALRREIMPIDSGITIDTVERFQGSERNHIILCLPLKSDNDLRLIESLSDDASIDRKLNVAISRAKHRIIILGNKGMCSKSVHYNHLIELIQQQGKIVDLGIALQELNSITK